MTLLKSTSRSTSAIERLIFNTSIQATDFTILEGICGVGKSTRMIKYIRENIEERYLVVLPLLDEIERYQEKLPELTFKVPLENNSTKTEQFKNFLRDKSNILCTHALFSLWDTEIEGLIAEAGYHIIIDEEVGIIESVGINAKVIENLMKLKYISIDSGTGLVTWDYEESGYDYNGEKEHQMVISKAKSGSLYCFDDKFFVYELPYRLFIIGDKYTIMTYLFKGNFMDAYFNSHSIKYNIKQIDPEEARSIKERARELIEFVPMTANMKNICNKHKRSKPFSKGFIERMTHKERKSFCDGIRNIVYKREKYDIERVMITCFKCFMKTDDDKVPKKNMMPRSMYTCLVPMNARGSNQWIDRDFVIHMVDHYPEPSLDKYMHARSNGSYNPDIYALSMLVQYIFRSAIRDKKHIKLMICSPRMEKLFKNWLAKPE
ncbi:hypothetical protein HRM2_17910 [Desulforapulum autotrophicum HRM2]|uniref:Uncharacterized protein n=1 Tax=Desulforapulum autotrophicum (strain ATCC 43914 / DSM 3382 / VKM B-1955 / HRM2) TaxID=177437 RepID=C0QB96_DESAH|nr:hypothetical protein [Desulforapulum autotrophicum]ACN14895.1 hypothetical protein HRM2_17910 [Desulforapulum autotrophicum HRM2]